MRQRSGAANGFAISQLGGSVSQIAPDPIYAAIETYKSVDAAFLVRCRYEDDLAEKGIKLARGDDDYRTPEMAALVDANIAARLALAETTPTTMAGLLAVLQFVREQSQDDFLFDGDEESTCFVASIEHAVLGMLPHR
jgi:hypothetical protein